MSLIPRLWPAPFCPNALELLEETVLVRLGGNGFENEEYADELVEAFDAVWRRGLDLPGECDPGCVCRCG